MDLWKKRQAIVVAGHRSDNHLISSALDDADPMVRRLALSAANRTGLLTVGHLRAALADPAHEVVHRAIELAARTPLGNEVADELIKLLADDRYCEVSAFALGELTLDGELLNTTTQALSDQAISHDDALARESAVAALGALGVGLEAVLAGTRDIATVRRRAILALVAFDDQRADEALRSALGDRDWQVRQSAEDLADPEQ